MNLNEFKDKMLKDKYCNEYVVTIDGKKIMFNYFSDEFYDVTDYEEEVSQITHGSLERHINKKVEVINFIRDEREDCFDDGGFCMYVGKYQGKYILGSNYISYNNEFSQEFINENKLEDQDEDIEYKFFDSLEEINDFVKEMMKITDDKLKDNKYWCQEMYDSDEMRFGDKFMFHCIRNLGNSFQEDQKINTNKILNITTDKYKPRFLDPVEFYDSWIEEEELENL